jgi:site-specific DNA recombinase
MRGRVYLRISDADQQDTVGVDRQLPGCLELAERKGWHVDPRPYEQGGDVYVDNDLSAAWSRKRPGKKKSGVKRPAYDAIIEAAISDAKAGRKSGIIGWDADRLTRDPRQNEDFIDLTEDYGIELATVTGDYDLAASGGRLHFRIKGAIARHESEHRSERVILKHAELRAAGKWQGGQRAFGYRVVPALVDNKIKFHLELDEAEAELIREAARRILQGGSLAGIAKDWAHRGIRRPKGRLWDTPLLREMLTSPRIAGLRQNGDGLVEADWPAIISREQHEQLRAILGTAPTKKGPKGPRSYLLSYMTICDTCGTTMVGKSRSGIPAYACRIERGGCGRLHRIAKPLDDYVRDEVLDALASPKFRAKLEIIYGQDGDNQASELVAKRDGALARLKQLRDLAGDPTVEFDPDDFAAAKRNLDRVIKETTAKLASFPASNALAGLPDTPELLHELWKRSDLDRRRALVRLAVDEVILKAPGKGQRFQPNAFPPGQERDKHVAEHVAILWRA